MYGWIVIVTFIVYLVVATVSIYYAFKHLSKPGMSSESRVLLTRRHISYILANVACQTYNVFSKVTTNINPLGSYHNYFFTFLIVLYFGQGIWLNLVRIFEPSYLPTLWFYTKNRVCSRKAKQKATKAVSDSEFTWAKID